MRKGIAIAAMALLAVSVPITAIVAQHARVYAAATDNPERPEADKARDNDRRPGSLMSFAGVRPGMKIVEIAPGGGYFTRLLSVAVGERGRVYAIAGRPSAAVDAWRATHGNVGMALLLPETERLAPEPADLVWTTNNYHDFKNQKIDEGDNAQRYNRLAFASLKPGGTYLVADHAAAAGAGDSQTSTLHRIEPDYVVREVEAAGFKLVGRSDLLRHPADDHSQKVFETGIQGKTDQFILKFVKPAGKR